MAETDKPWDIWAAIDRQGDIAYDAQQARRAELERLLAERSAATQVDVAGFEPEHESLEQAPAEESKTGEHEDAADA